MRRTTFSLVTLLGGFAAVAAAGEPAADPPSDATIRSWIERLGSPQFSIREESSRGLASAGSAAVAPLAEAAVGADLEVSSRAIEILGGFLAAEDPAVSGPAEKAIESLVDGPEGSSQQMARAALEFHNVGLAKAAAERIESLGGRILTETPGAFHVVINASWRGDLEDLRHLSRIRGIVHVGIHGVKLDDRGARYLARLRGMRRLELYGTGLGSDAIAGMRKSLPETQVDVRRGGKLGVGGQPMVGPCIISHVEPGSAAAEAGLSVGDIVLEINGEPVAMFDDLTAKVGEHGAGDTIDLKVQRDNEQTVRKVTLGGWR